METIPTENKIISTIKKKTFQDEVGWGHTMAYLLIAKATYIKDGSTLLSDNKMEGM
jgi:hypothetical protein